MTRGQRLGWIAAITALIGGAAFGYFALRPLPRDPGVLNPDPGYLVDSTAVAAAESLASPPPRPVPVGLDGGGPIPGSEGQPISEDEGGGSGTGSNGSGGRPTPLGAVLLDTPRPDQLAESPLWIAGRARGSWYFEGQFPVRLVDENDSLLASGVARATGDWMTPEYVPFSVTLHFERPESDRGALILEKDNPSGLSEHAGAVRVPLRFR